MPQVHIFETTGEAYDGSQCRDDISNGDVLAVPSEGVVGVLVEAWPVAITKEHGAFHTYMPGWHWNRVGITGKIGATHDYSASLTLARERFPAMTFRETSS